MNVHPYERIPAAGAAGRGRDLPAGFVSRCHELLAAGYARLDRSVLQHEEEPAITGFLVRELRNFVESPEAPAWAARFAVLDDPPLNHLATAGKSRPRVDLEFEITQRGPRPRFQFEAAFTQGQRQGVLGRGRNWKLSFRKICCGARRCRDARLRPGADSERLGRENSEKNGANEKGAPAGRAGCHLGSARRSGLRGILFFPAQPARKAHPHSPHVPGVLLAGHSLRQAQRQP